MEADGGWGNRMGSRSVASPEGWLTQPRPRRSPKASTGPGAEAADTTREGSAWGVPLKASQSMPTMPVVFNLRGHARSNRPQFRAHEYVTTNRTSAQLLLTTVKDAKLRTANQRLVDALNQRDEDHRGQVAKQKAIMKKEQARMREERKKAREEEAEQLYWEQLRVVNAEYERVRRAQVEQAEQEEAERLAAEKLRAAEIERERIRRLPWNCPVCEGSGKCLDCDGEGFIESCFLAPQVSHARNRYESSVCFKAPTIDPALGIKPQGCKTCGGLHVGILGQPKYGDGACTNCAGEGKLWPRIAPSPSPKARRESSPASFALDISARRASSPASFSLDQSSIGGP